MLIFRPPLAFQHGAVDIRDHGVRGYNTLMDVGNNYVGIHCKLGLRVSGSAIVIRRWKNAH